MRQSKVMRYAEGEKDEPTFFRSGVTTWHVSLDNKVISDMHRIYGGKGKGANYIFNPVEMWAEDPTSNYVFAEIAICEETPGDGTRQLHAFDFVAKQRLDGAVPQALSVLRNSAPLKFSAHSDARFDGIADIRPNTLHGAILQAKDNPDAVLFEYSGDMLIERKGKRYLPGIVDGKRVGLQCIDLEKEN